MLCSQITYKGPLYGLWADKKALSIQDKQKVVKTTKRKSLQKMPFKVNP